MLLRGAIEILGHTPELELWRAFGRNLFFIMGSALPMIGTIGFLLMCNDRINEELTRLAMLDPLTGVFNRRTFEERAATVIDEAARGVSSATRAATKRCGSSSRSCRRRSPKARS
jgi:hypothetical protein